MTKEEKAQNLLDEIFTEILSQYGNEAKKEQVELSQRILKGLQKSKIFMSDTEVGNGKTYAYIIAATVNKIFDINAIKTRNSYPVTKEFYKSHGNMPILISTSNTALQNAIVNYYIPEISKMLLQREVITKPLSAVIRKSRKHYICDMRLESCANKINKAKHPDDYAKLIELRLQKFNQIDLDKITDLPGSLKNKICVTSQCSHRCNRYDICRYNKYLDYLKSYDHDFQICNHDYFLADIMRRNQGQNTLIPNYSALILDEAHMIPEATQLMYGATINADEIIALRNQISQLKFKSGNIGKEFKKYINRMTDIQDKLFENLIVSVKNEYFKNSSVVRYRTELSENTLLYINEIIKVLEEISKSLNIGKLCYKGQNNLLYYIQKQIRTLIGKFNIFQNTENIACRLEVGVNGRTDRVRLYGIPGDIGKRLYRDLWLKNIPMIFTSAALAENHAFSRIEKLLGLDYVDKNRVENYACTKQKLIKNKEI